MDLVICVLLLGNISLRDCRRDDNKQQIAHFIHFFKKSMTQKSLLQERTTISIDILKKMNVYERHILYLQCCVVMPFCCCHHFFPLDI